MCNVWRAVASAAGLMPDCGEAYGLSYTIIDARAAKLDADFPPDAARTSASIYRLQRLRWRPLTRT